MFFQTTWSYVCGSKSYFKYSLMQDVYELLYMRTGFTLPEKAVKLFHILKQLSQRRCCRSWRFKFTDFESWLVWIWTNGIQEDITKVKKNDQLRWYSHWKKGLSKAFQSIMVSCEEFLLRELVFIISVIVSPGFTASFCWLEPMWGAKQLIMIVNTSQENPI